MMAAVTHEEEKLAYSNIQVCSLWSMLNDVIIGTFTMDGPQRSLLLRIQGSLCQKTALTFASPNLQMEETKERVVVVSKPLDIEKACSAETDLQDLFVSRLRQDKLYKADVLHCLAILDSLSEVNTGAQCVCTFLKASLALAENRQIVKGIASSALLSTVTTVLTLVIGGDVLLAYMFQIFCNTSKAFAWMAHNVLRTKFHVDFGPSFVGLCKTFLFTALPFVLPEYFFNFASMNKARIAGITLPFLLNFGLIVDKGMQYLLAWISGELPSRGDWISLAGIIVAVVVGALVDGYADQGEFQSGGGHP